jgi:hypothetical protein
MGAKRTGGRTTPKQSPPAAHRPRLDRRIAILLVVMLILVPLVGVVSATLSSDDPRPPTAPAEGSGGGFGS